MEKIKFRDAGIKRVYQAGTGINISGYIFLKPQIIDT